MHGVSPSWSSVMLGSAASGWERETMQYSGPENSGSQVSSSVRGSASRGRMAASSLRWSRCSLSVPEAGRRMSVLVSAYSRLKACIAW